MQAEVDFLDVNILLGGIRAEIREEYNVSHSRPICAKSASSTIVRLADLRAKLEYWELVFSSLEKERDS